MTPKCGTTHYTGCACWEAQRDRKIAALESEIATLRASERAAVERAEKAESAVRGLLALGPVAREVEYVLCGIGTNTADGRAILAALAVAKEGAR